MVGGAYFSTFFSRSRYSSAALSWQRVFSLLVLVSLVEWVCEEEEEEEDEEEDDDDEETWFHNKTKPTG